jgi:hypothetical protein
MHPHGMHMLNGNGIFYRAMHPDGMRNILSTNNSSFYLPLLGRGWGEAFIKKRAAGMQQMICRKEELIPSSPFSMNNHSHNTIPCHKKYRNTYLKLFHFYFRDINEKAQA